MVFYGALTVTILLYITGHALPATAVLVVMFVIPLILIMLKEPLTRIVEKKTPAIEGGKAMYFVQSFFELFEVMLSYLSNTLSFVRVGAFAVSHACNDGSCIDACGSRERRQYQLADYYSWKCICMCYGRSDCRNSGSSVWNIMKCSACFYKGSGREFKPFLKNVKTNH